jgi:phosphate-selective porin OprO/OprP
VPGKERGAMIHGDPFKGVYYGLAVSTGRGKNVSNKDKQVEGVDVIGRLSANLAAMMGSTSDAVYHVGVDFSHGYLSQNQTTGSGAAIAAGNFKAVGGTTEARGVAFFAPNAFSAALTTEEVERTRYGLEGAVAYGPFKVQGEWMRHNYEGNASTAVNGQTTFDKDIDAWYIAGAWMVTGESIASTYKDGLWGRLKPKSNFNPTGPGMGGVLLSLRYSELDASDFGLNKGPGSIQTAGRYVFNGVTYTPPSGAHAWTASAQWLLTPNTRLIANYVETRFEDGNFKVTNDAGTTVGASDKERAFTVRAQFDF